MKKIKFTLLAVALLGLSNVAHAANYYVSPSGSGDGKSYSSPCSLASGLSKIVAGDSLFLLGGQYDLTATLVIQKAGTASKLTFVGAYPGEKPILDFRTQKFATNANGVNLKNNYIHLKGLTIRYAAYKGIQNTGSYNIMENLDVYGNGDSGVQQKGGNNNIILNCDSHENFDFRTMGSGTKVDFGGNADGFADKQYTNSPGNTYIGCRSWNNSDDGWDFFQRVGGTTIFKNCICYNNGPQYYDMSSYARLETDADWFDNYKTETTVTSSKGSFKCSVSHYYNNGNGNGFKLGGDNTKHDATLYRCLSVSNSVKGFDQNNNAGTVKIYNCTSYNNGYNYGFGNDNGLVLDIENSVDLASASKSKFISTVTSKNNTWSSGFCCSTSDFVSTDVTLAIAPRNADGSLPDNDLLHLNAGSSLIDKGVIIDGIEYNGAAPDLGCYETGGTTGISEIETPDVKDVRNVAIYNLSGEKMMDGADLTSVMSQLPHGVFVVRPAGSKAAFKIAK